MDFYNLITKSWFYGARIKKLRKNRIALYVLLNHVKYLHIINIESTRQVSSVIHSARPIVTPVANIVFCCFVFLDLESGDGQTWAKTMIPTGHDFGLAEWIKNCSLRNKIA